MPSLAQTADLHLSELARQVVADTIKKDFTWAGACLAADLFTACGFHAMRALETEARTYHTIVTGVEMTDVPLWVLIDGDQKTFPGSGLRGQHEKEGSPQDSQLGLVIALLAYLNKIYRRPIMHPEMTLNHETAKEVFDATAIAISAMVADGEHRREAKSGAHHAAQ